MYLFVCFKNKSLIFFVKYCIVNRVHMSNLQPTKYNIYVACKIEKCWFEGLWFLLCSECLSILYWSLFGLDCRKLMFVRNVFQ